MPVSDPTKRCPGCGLDFPRDPEHFHKSGYCIECGRARAIAWRHSDAGRRAATLYSASAAGKKRSRRWSRSEGGRSKKRELRERWSEANIWRVKALAHVRDLVKRGKIEKSAACEECGAKRLPGNGFDSPGPRVRLCACLAGPDLGSNPARPYGVKWLCVACWYAATGGGAARAPRASLAAERPTERLPLHRVDLRDAAVVPAVDPVEQVARAPGSLGLPRRLG